MAAPTLKLPSPAPIAAVPNTAAVPQGASVRGEKQPVFQSLVDSAIKDGQPAERPVEPSGAPPAGPPQVEPNTATQDPGGNPVPAIDAFVSGLASAEADANAGLNAALSSEAAPVSETDTASTDTGLPSLLSGQPGLDVEDPLVTTALTPGPDATIDSTQVQSDATVLSNLSTNDTATVVSDRAVFPVEHSITAPVGGSGPSQIVQANPVPAPAVGADSATQSIHRPDAGTQPVNVERYAEAQAWIRQSDGRHVSPQPVGHTAASNDLIQARDAVNAANAASPNTALADSDEQVLAQRPVASGAEQFIRAAVERRAGSRFESALATSGGVKSVQELGALLDSSGVLHRAATAPVSLHSATVTTGVNATAVPMHSFSLDAPFRSPAWTESLGQRIVWMNGQHIQGAEIRLNPPELGPLEVRIDVRHDQTQVSFNAQHASVRDALEAAMPRLREMLSSSGMNLVDVNVSGQSESGRQASRFTEPHANSSMADRGVIGEEDASMVVHGGRAVSQGLLDIFA